MKQLLNTSIFKQVFGVALLCLFSLIVGQDKAKTAPDFKTRDLKGKIVKSVTLYENGPCFVFFWHSCCGLNKDQLKALKEVYEQYNDKGFEIVGIALDGGSKTAKVKKAVTIYKMPWINVVDKNNTIKDKFNPTAVPSLFVINKGGIITSLYGGYQTGDDVKIKNELKKLFLES